MFIPLVIAPGPPPKPTKKNKNCGPANISPKNIPANAKPIIAPVATANTAQQHLLDKMIILENNKKEIEK